MIKFSNFQRFRSNKTRIVSGKMSSGLLPHAQSNQWMPNYLGHNRLCYFNKTIKDVRNLKFDQLYFPKYIVPKCNSIFLLFCDHKTI